MKIKPLKIAGSYEIRLERRSDERGYFMRFYDREIFARHDLKIDWRQESQSFNLKANTIRALHFQLPPQVETKLVRVVQGAILDVWVDLRTDSETFGVWDSLELSAENDRAVYIPAGCAHGFRTLTENALVEYKIDVPFDAALADGIRWNDPTLNIDWKLSDGEALTISERDAGQKLFADFTSPFRL